MTSPKRDLTNTAAPCCFVAPDLLLLRVLLLLLADPRPPGAERPSLAMVSDLKVGKIAGADFVEITPLVVVVALGMRIDEIIRTEFVEHGGIARDHGSIAPFLESPDLVDRYIALRLFRHIDLSLRA